MSVSNELELIEFSRRDDPSIRSHRRLNFTYIRKRLTWRRLPPAARAIGVFAIFTSLSMLIGILTVSFTSPKSADRTCSYVLQSEARTSIKEDSLPYFITVGDLNNDSRPDLVVANSGTHNIGVFLRRANNTFTDQTTHSTGLASSPRAVALADFNHDGVLDIAVANFGAHNVGLFLGTGNGTFASMTIFPTNTARPHWIAVGEFNNDEHLDVAVANDGTDNIGILIGDGNGGFSSWTMYSTGFDSKPYSMALDDINGDTHTDILVANYGTSDVSLFLGYGDGTFNTETTIVMDENCHPESIVVADFNRDGFVDVVVACTRAQFVGVLLGQGNTAFGPVQRYSTGPGSWPSALLTGNFDSDNKTDIIVANYETGILGVFHGDGKGDFTNQSIYYSDYELKPQSITAADFNNDTRLDIALVNYDFDYVDIVLGFRNYTFLDQTLYRTTGLTSPPRSVAVADLNKDGRLDMIAVSWGNSKINRFINNGNYAFGLYTIGWHGGGNGACSIVSGDFNNDSRADVAVLYSSTGNVTVFFGDGYGYFYDAIISSTSTDSDPLFLAVGDVNNDFRPDLIVVHSATGSIGVLLGYGNGSFVSQKLSSTGDASQPRAVALGDFNNDRRLDVAVANYGTSAVLILLGNGDGTFVQGVSYSIGYDLRPVAIAVGDVNGDGSMDMVFASSGNGSVVVLLGSGDGSFSKRGVYSLGSSSPPSSIALGKMNNDSFLDITVANSQSDTVVVLLGYGDGSFSVLPAYQLKDDSAPVFLLVADMNNDQRSDLVVVNEGTGDVSILPGYGNGSLATPQIYSTETRPLPGSALIEDLNNDHRLDILITNEFGANVEIFWGDGDGKFSTRSNYPTAFDAAPISTAVGDFNNDTHVDFVLANFEGNDLHVFLGDGRGSFSDTWHERIGDDVAPRAITVGDCNNDGYLDVVVASQGWSKILLFFGNGNGTFVRRGNYSTGEYAQPRWIGLADFNQDGWLDVIVANNNAATLGIFFGIGNGTFAAQMTLQVGLGTGATSAAIGDFNRDGYPDFGMSNYFSDLLKVFLTGGNDTFLLNQTYSTGAISRPKYSAVADLNNDGQLDILVTGELTNRLLVFFGVGDGTFFDGITYYTGDNTHPIAVTTGDLNNDNLTDAVVVNIESGTIGIFLGKIHTNGVSEGTYSTGSASHPRAIALGHFNGDTQLDIVMANYGRSNVALLVGRANGSFPTQSPISTGVLSRPSSMAVDDFNGDNRTDVAVTDTFAAAVRVLYSYGNGSFAPLRSYSAGIGSVPQAIAAGDFNNDNRVDLVVGNSGTRTISTLLRYDSGALAKPMPYYTGPNSSPRAVAVGELNGDGYVDFVVIDTDSTEIMVFLNFGNGSFYGAPSYSAGTETLPVSILLVDVNSDSHLDIIIAQCWGDAIGVFLGFGDGTFSNPSISHVGDGSGPEGMAVADLNHDGRVDVAVVSQFNHQLGILYGIGDGTFVSVKSYFTGQGSGPIAVAIRDVNKDAYLDIIVANFGGSNVLIFQGTSDGNFTVTRNLPTGKESYPTAVAVDDLNQDGSMDIVVTTSRAANISIFFGRGGGSFSSQVSFSTGIGSGPRALVLGDFNNDTQIDAAVANYATNNVGILLGHVEGGFFSLLTYSTGASSQPSSLAVADFNNDSRLDIVVANTGSNTASVLLGYKTEDFVGAPHSRLANSSQPVSIAVQDLNEDGKLDIVVADNGTSSILVMLGTGHGMFTPHTNYSTGNNSLPRSVAIADVNGDALPDVVVANSGSGNVGVLLGVGNGTFAPQKPYSTGPASQPYAVAVLDFDNDSRLDIAVASYGSNSVGVFFGLGNGSFVDEVVFHAGYLSRPYGLAVGDVNGDNLADIVASNNGFGNIDILTRTC